MTFQEIADVLGITKQRAEFIYRRAMRKMIRVSSRHEIGSLLAEIQSRRAYAFRTKPADTGWRS